MTAYTVESRLAATIGLDVHSVGLLALADAVKKRMATCGLTEEGAYLERLNTAPDELAALIEMVVVPETWFFRDREPFAFLAQFVSEKWIASHPDDILKVLSIPSSSGEEPYSIAMTLQSAGLPPERYRIDAVDISSSLLRKAERGVYGANSFRSALPDHCERYFRREGTGRTVIPEARAGIRFIHGNIMTLPKVVTDQTYNIILCRNLLIYQHAAAREHIITALDRLLYSGGLLFVGHAEMMSLLTDRYEPVRHRGAFVYRKTGTRQRNAVLESGLAREAGVGPAAAGDVARSVLPAGKRAPSAAVHAKPGVMPVQKHESSLESRIDRVRGLADQGRLDDAAVICRDLLKEAPQLAEAHLLQGLIQVAAGQAVSAEECFNRALYLDADCYEALVHLSLLKARRGDEAGAERLRRQAGRMRDKAQVPA
jgi:chemotaxis protein methyltransferase WspC